MRVDETIMVPILSADSILRTIQDVQRVLNSECILRDLNIIYNLMMTASRSNRENNKELPGWEPEEWVELGSCLAKVCGLDGPICGDLDCVKPLAKQHKQLTILIGNIDESKDGNGIDCRLTRWN